MKKRVQRKHGLPTPRRQRDDGPKNDRKYQKNQAEYAEMLRQRIAQGKYLPQKHQKENEVVLSNQCNNKKPVLAPTFKEVPVHPENEYENVIPSIPEGQPRPTYASIAQQASQMLENLKQMDKPKPIFAPTIPLQSIKSIRKNLPPPQPFELSKDNYMFSQSKVETPPPGFSIRKSAENHIHDEKRFLPPPPKPTTQRLDTASEMIYPDGHRVVVSHSSDTHHSS